MASRAPGFLDGLGGVPAGVRFVRGHPRLWAWIALPLLVDAAIFLGLSLLGWHAARALQAQLAAASWGWFDGARAFLAPTIGVLLTLVSVLAALLATLLLSGVVNAPVHDALSAQVQRLVEGRAEDSRPWSALLPDAWAAFRAALSLALLQGAVLGLLFALSFTAVGAPLFAAAGFGFTGFGLADVTLARWRLDARARRRWARRHAGLLLGLGLPVNLLPPLAPFGVVGATLLCLRIEAGDPRAGG